MEHIVRAVDIGRGNTKYTTGVDNGEIKCAHFPSEAHPMETEEEKDALGVKRKTIGVPVDELIYEVGPDVHLAADVFNAKVLQHDAYCDTAEYKALLKGALHYMKVDTVDLLVVGLPVSTCKVKKRVSALERNLVGAHDIGKGKIVNVAKVKAIAQPAGALMYYGCQHNCVVEMRKERSLIIDVGRRTFDWLVTHGMQQIDKRSHSVNRGMFDVLQVIANGIGRTNGSLFREYELIDSALRSGKRPVIFQKEYDITKHLPLARKIAEQAVAEMMHYVGDASDIKNIILVGGGAFFFKKAIKEAFPRHKLQEIEDPLYANVKGFQLAGVGYVRTPATSEIDAPQAKSESIGE